MKDQGRLLRYILQTDKEERKREAQEIIIRRGKLRWSIFRKKIKDSRISL